MFLPTAALDVLSAPSAFAEPAPLGRYPTPVEPVPSLSRSDCELWVKRDDLTHPVYGGNKVRKLDRILADAKRARPGGEHARQTVAMRIATLGAVGSHHVLAT